MSLRQIITPSLWFDHHAEAAAEFYVSLFPNSRVSSVVKIASGPGEDAAIVEFELDGQQMSAVDGGAMVQFSEAVSFVVSCETQEEIDHYWNGLSEGGETQQCGWLKDRFGLSWQIVPAELSELTQSAPVAVMDALLRMTKIEIEPLREAARNGKRTDDN